MCDVTKFTKYILITGNLRMVVGLGYNLTYLSDVETISMEDSEPCGNLPDYPGQSLSNSMSGVTRGILYICGGNNGGTYTDECKSFQNGDWVEESPMQFGRYSAAAAVTYDGRIFMTGGTGQ